MSPLLRRLSAAVIAVAIAALAAAYAVPRLEDLDPEMTVRAFQIDSLYYEPGDLVIGSRAECVRLAAQHFDSEGCKPGEVKDCWRVPGSDFKVSGVSDEGCRISFLISFLDSHMASDSLRVIHARAAAPRRALAVAFVVASAVFLTHALPSEAGNAVAVTPEGSSEGSEAARRAALHRGARLKAARAVLGDQMKRIVSYRFAQVANAIFAVGILNTIFKPILAEALLLVFWGLPALAALGPRMLARIVSFVAPLGSTLAGHPGLMPWGVRLVLACSAATPWLWVMVVALMLTAEFLGVGLIDLEPVTNGHALLQWVFQGRLAQYFMFSLLCCGFLTTLVFGCWTLYLLCRGACGLRSPQAAEAERQAIESLKQRVRDLEEKILEAALARWAAAGTGDGGSNAQEGMTNLLAPTAAEEPPAVDFPEDIKPEVAIEGPLPSFIGAKLGNLYRFAWLPGGIYKALSVLVTDIGLDMFFSLKLIWQGHYYFGGIMGSFALTSTMWQVRCGLWGRLVKAVKETLASGIQTDDFLDMHETERGLEALPASMVTFYAMPFMGMATMWDILPAALSLGLSIYGLTTYIIDTVDLDLGSD